MTGNATTGAGMALSGASRLRDDVGSERPYVTALEVVVLVQLVMTCTRGGIFSLATVNSNTTGSSYPLDSWNEAGYQEGCRTAMHSNRLTSPPSCRQYVWATTGKESCSYLLQPEGQ